MRAKSGNNSRRVKKEYSTSGLVRKSCFRLLRSVMVMIGKLVLSVNTGNSDRK